MSRRVAGLKQKFRLHIGDSHRIWKVILRCVPLLYCNWPLRSSDTTRLRPMQPQNFHQKAYPETTDCRRKDCATETSKIHLPWHPVNSPKPRPTVLAAGLCAIPALESHAVFLILSSDRRAKSRSFWSCKTG